MVEESAPSSGDDRISVRNLVIGSKLEQDIFDPNGVLLLRAGHEILQRFVTNLRRRGVREIRRTSSGAARRRAAPPDRTAEDAAVAATTPRLDSAVEAASYDALPGGLRASGARLDLPALHDELQIAQDFRRRAIEQYARLTADIIEGRPVDLDAVQGTLGEFAAMFDRDASLSLLAMDLKSSPEGFLYEHGINVSMLTMTVALFMGFSGDQAIEAGLGALFHDVGMLKVPETIRLAERRLSDDEFYEVRRHPAFSANLLDRLDHVRETSILVAYQMHERHDGSGYPCGRVGRYIHPLARVAAVADSYAAGCGWRPYRAPLRPYDSMVEIILKDTRSGRFDADVVRGFLDCLSLFPVGSEVNLSDARTARVLRSNAGQHTRPVVLPVGADDSAAELDLAVDETIQIVEALGGDAAPEAA